MSAIQIQRKQLYEVAACEKRGSYNTMWDVVVVANSLREARRLGVDALEKNGIINRLNIRETSVHCTGQDVWV